MFSGKNGFSGCAIILGVSGIYIFYLLIEMTANFMQTVKTMIRRLVLRRLLLVRTVSLYPALDAEQIWVSRLSLGCTISLFQDVLCIKNG